MPIYEFYCKDCREPFEILVRSGQNDIECPQCSGHDVTRQLSTFASQGTEKRGGGSSCGGCTSSSCSSCG
jgi:putative FmdB family regulatory protein